MGNGGQSRGAAQQNVPSAIGHEAEGRKEKPEEPTRDEELLTGNEDASVASDAAGPETVATEAEAKSARTESDKRGDVPTDRGEQIEEGFLDRILSWIGL